MGLLQTAYETYANHRSMVGIAQEKKEPLLPISHIMAKAQIEILLDQEGNFIKADSVAKEQDGTLIPVTISSANRTGKNTRAHPLNDQLRYLSSLEEEKLEVYEENLTKWAESSHSHPKVRGILKYIQGGTILDDLAASQVIERAEDGTLTAGRIAGTAYDRCLVRFRVLSDNPTDKTATWEDASLHQSFVDYYGEEMEVEPQDICFLTGKRDVISDMHPKGVVAASYGAKLLSANDSRNFTYRGRFETAEQAYNVGYTASQMAHNALRWLVANEGIYMGDRVFLCWNPRGKPLRNVIAFSRFVTQEEEAEYDFVGYQRQLLLTMNGYRQSLEATDEVVIASLEAATTGRLAVTYYQELTASAFLDNVTQWYTTCCWPFGRFGIQSPPIRQIVDAAFGTYRDPFFETDPKILRQHSQRLVHAMVTGGRIPRDIVRGATVKAGELHLYSRNARQRLLSTACAVIRKHRNDTYEKENWTMALDETNQNRSYLFGRLLAVADVVEQNALRLRGQEGRETNAMRLQQVYSQRPLYGWRILHEKLAPYFAGLPMGLQVYYKKIIGDIMNLFESNDEQWLSKRLEDVYLLGYYHQNSALYGKKDKTEGEDLA